MNNMARAKRFALPRWWPLAAVVLAAVALIAWRVTRDLMLAFLGIPVSKPNPPCSGLFINSVIKPCLTASLLASSSAPQEQAGAISEWYSLEGQPGQIASEAEAEQ
jgi:hypothetical protein